MAAITALKGIINKGHARSINAKKNILASILIRGLSIAINLLLVPLTINYLNPTKYGIWITISSIVGWMSFFDIGLTNGLRNKLALAITKKDQESAQIYISTTYATLSLIFFALWITYILISPYLDWTTILNVPKDLNQEVSKLALIVVSYFCLQFVLRIVSTILVADQKPAYSSFVDAGSQLVSLILILILTSTTKGSLVHLGLVLCGSTISVLLLTNIILFKSRYKVYAPRWSKIKFKTAKGLFNLGLVFFVIQVAGIVQYETANVIIAKNFKLEEVTSYNIVFRYFGVLNMVNTILLAPFWSSTTEAFYRKDISWIKNSVKRYKQASILLILLGFLMLIVSEKIYKTWIGEQVMIPFQLSLWGLVYFSVTVISGKYLSFLNGINALRIQFIACLISPITYILLANILINKYQLGVYSLFIAAVIANFNGYILAPLQYHMVINKNKKGIWLK